MTLYRSKPLEVNAYHYGVEDEPKWFKKALEMRYLFKHEDKIIYFDSLGMQTAYPGDWIIEDNYTYIFYIDSVFKKKYEKVE